MIRSWAPKTGLTSKAESPRARRVADMILVEVSELLRLGVADPRLGLVSLTKVEMTKDLKIARLFYSVLSDDEQVLKEAEAGLSSARGFVRSHLAKTLGLRYTPEVQFRHDLALVRQAEMERILKEIALDDRARSE